MGRKPCQVGGVGGKVKSGNLNGIFPTFLKLDGGISLLFSLSRVYLLSTTQPVAENVPLVAIVAQSFFTIQIETVGRGGYGSVVRRWKSAESVGHESGLMNTYYLLPPRRELARRFIGYLQAWFPGVQSAADSLPDLIAATAEQSRGVTVIFADDLPNVSETELERVLIDQFGAVMCDRVFDLREGPQCGETRLESWPIRGLGRMPLRKVC